MYCIWCSGTGRQGCPQEGFDVATSRDFNTIFGGGFFGLLDLTVESYCVGTRTRRLLSDRGSGRVVPIVTAGNASHFWAGPQSMWGIALVRFSGHLPLHCKVVLENA